MGSGKGARTPGTIWLGALMAALMAALITSPALGRTGQIDALSAMHQPDGRVRLQKHVGFQLHQIYDNPWTGNNIYNTAATNQKVITKEVTSEPRPGSERWIFGISIQNDGIASDRFKVTASGPTVTGWKVEFFHGTENITPAVVAGTFRTPWLGHGATYLVKAKVIRNEPNLGTTARLVTLTSVAHPTKKDAVEFGVKFKGGNG